MLHLILQGNPAARGIVELAPVIQKHNEWLAGKKFLLVPYHMIGKHDMESGVLGNYVSFIRKTHPDAPIPPVYVSATIIGQAEAERASYGDLPFFKRLNEGVCGLRGLGRPARALGRSVVRRGRGGRSRFGAALAPGEHPAQNGRDRARRGA